MGRASVALCRSGLSDRVTELSREQFVDPDQFNAQRFPVALYLAGETYVKTVNRDGDGQQAIVSYLKGGGFLVLLPSEPYPMFYGNRSGAANVDPLLPKLGVPLTVAFESPPPGSRLMVKVNRRQDLLAGLPATFAFPATGDQRLRAFDPAAIGSDVKYTPLLSVADSVTGKSYGDAGAYLTFTSGPFQGARILYLWCTVLTDGRVGGALLEDALTLVMKAAM
jgi:hypothetical protein